VNRECQLVVKTAKPGRAILSQSSSPVRREYVMNTHLVEQLQPQPERRELTLIACSICLRVRRGSEWVEAEHVINEIRSYELDAPPRFRPAVCDVCTRSALSRRASADELLAA
jgi:hypothetical protein